MAGAAAEVHDDARAPGGGARLGPRNRALAALDASHADAPRLWADYLRIWTRWNHVRTLAATAAFILALRPPGLG